MSLINDKDIAWFGVWAEKNEDKGIFPVVTETVESYYVNRYSAETYIMEYTPGTVEEIKDALEMYSGLSDDEQMLKKLTIALCQYRFRNKIEINKGSGWKEETVQDDKKTLPEYVYAF